MNRIAQSIKNRLMPENTPDSKYTRQIPEKIKKNDLLLTDLGYFCLKTFQLISQKGAFYISR